MTARCSQLPGAVAFCASWLCAFAQLGCYRSASPPGDGDTVDTETGPGPDTETDADADSDVDSDADSDTDSDTGCVLFVDGSLDDYTGHNGGSWESALETVQDGLGMAAATVITGMYEDCDVWVAAGTYTPTLDASGESEPADPRGKTFELEPHVALYGGFAGTETLFGERDIDANETILSGDLGAAIDNSDNCYHVVTGADDAVLDGFTVTRGNADGEGEDRSLGGGMLNLGAAPIVAGCRFRDNAARRGGGMYNDDQGGGGSPAVTGCAFEINRAELGGGMFNRGSSPSISDSSFIDNEAAFDPGDPDGTGRGGGVYNVDSAPRFERCAFHGNWAHDGGGMCNDDGAAPTVVGCSFESNSATFGDGGAVLGSGTGIAQRFVGCTFSDNWAFSGAGAISNEGSAPDGVPVNTIEVVNSVFTGNETNLSSDGNGIVLSNDNYAEAELRGCVVLGGSATGTGCLVAGMGPLVVANSILWRIAAPFCTDASAAIVTSSDVQGGWDGEGNIDADPLFADADTDGGELDLRLQPGSPCIDTGSTAALPSDAADIDSDGDTDEPLPLDLDGDPRVAGASVDMGAYEME